MANVEIIAPKRELILNSDSGLYEERKKRVCAYCRVSTDDVDQQNSYQVQVNEYTKRIKSNPDWEFVRIYADDGISGTDTKKRVGFNEMMKGAREHKFDLLITKSVSRFARNTLTTVQSIRELKSLGVFVKFETEGVSTDDPSSEMMLTILSSMAQEEARHTSMNVNWNVQARMKNGVPIVNTTTFLGYSKDKDGRLVIVPEEAKIIKEIYELYTSMVGPCEIARILESKGYKTGRGNTHWNLSLIQSILKNEKYKGDLLQQKTYTVDFLTHKRAKNRGEKQQFLIKNNHEAIVSEEMWDKAKEIREQRFRTQFGDDHNLYKYLSKYPFTGLLMCMNCGGSFKRRYWNYGFSSEHVVLQCTSHINSSSKCDPGAIDLKTLEECTFKVINELFKERKDIVNDISSIDSKVIRVNDFDIKVSSLKERKKIITEKMSTLLDIKLNAKSDNETKLYNEKYQKLIQELDSINKELEKYHGLDISDGTLRSRFDVIKAKLKEYEDGKFELTGELLHSFINKILVVDKEHIIYLVPKDRVYSNEKIRNNRKTLSEKLEIGHGEHSRKAGSKTYKINYKIVLI